MYSLVAKLIVLFNAFKRRIQVADNDLINLEIKITYLEEALATLNELLIDQTKELQFLKERLKKIENKIEEGKLDNTSLPFEKPPHY